MMLLGRPLNIGGMEIRNRIVVPAMSDFGAETEDGLVHSCHIERYEAFARGGAGLVVTEACSAVRMREKRDTIVLESDGCIPGLRNLAGAVHRHGAAVLVQIMLTGLAVMREKSIAEISRDDFLRCKAAFVSAAVRCRKAGLNGIELHAAHGMYLDEVIETSARDDEYGGSFENRVRLLTELIREIRDACGRDFVIAVRFGNPDYGELLKTAAAIEGAGGDLLDVSTGTGPYRNVPDGFPFDAKIYAASLVKKQAHLPVICVGGIFTGSQGEAVLQSGYADLTAVGRGHLADPAWAGKTLAGQVPDPCLRCRVCLWYIDGKMCPAGRRRK
jgi:NADPH2 dehydrogenase